MKRYLFVLTNILLVITFSFCSSTSQTSEQESDSTSIPTIQSIHVSLGVPIDNDSTDDYLIVRPQYVLSYNKNRNVPNWVSWNLDSSWYGTVERFNGNFISDTTLPADFYKVKHSDYTNSGYDRGHMVRSEERTKTVEDNKSTFLLTNIIPQRPDLNRGAWLKLESYCESLCKDSTKELFVIAGGIFHSDNKINDKVAIPDSCFKIVVILNYGELLESVSDTTHTVAVVMPNINGIRNDDWKKYSTTIRRIEQSTGYDFLSSVSRSIQDVIENK
ncbi:MAG: DNA/RNA non-specific endonuclease [Bacteroidota bacterium]